MRSRAGPTCATGSCSYALNNTRTLLLPLYATVYLPPLLRLLGAKIGKGAEVSTVMQFVPDLIEVGNGSFLADACMVGGARIHNGRIELGRVTIGEKAFIGNSALVPAAPMSATTRCWACFPPGAGRDAGRQRQVAGLARLLPAVHPQGALLRRSADLSPDARGATPSRAERCHPRAAAGRDLHRLARRVRDASWSRPSRCFRGGRRCLAAAVLAAGLAFATHGPGRRHQAAADGYLRARPSTRCGAATCGTTRSSTARSSPSPRR